MLIDHVGATHSIKGRRVKGKRPAFKNRTHGYTVFFADGTERFIGRGVDIEVTGYTDKLPAGNVDSTVRGPRLTFDERTNMVTERR